MLDVLRRDALAIFRAAVAAVDPGTCVKRVVDLRGETLTVAGMTYALSCYDEVVVIGAGKASPAMAGAMEEMLGDRICAGMINTKYGHGRPLRRIEVNECGHPIPDHRGVEGTEKMLRLVEQARERSLVICLISGGGSALLPAPPEGISLTDKQETTSLLLASGASIGEMNVVRKHLSQVKGGQLARTAAPATVVTLVLSDVIGDPLDVIASGPTVPDRSTFAECTAILERYDLTHNVPDGVQHRIRGGIAGQIEETPKPGDPVFERCRATVIGNNRIALKAAKQEAEGSGYRTLVLSSVVRGEAREAALFFTAIGQEILTSREPIAPPACLIAGGETTVTVRGKGKGGRNQEFVLAGAIAIADVERTILFSAGTDGTDGPTDVAGAIADGWTVKRAHVKGMDPSHFLKENDAYPFFRALDDLIITGPTGTNVMDIAVLLVG
ncbi:MAG: glycerate kinase [Candidatus Latescibacteria bacterium]|nr:glycerate kinase [Candidatus Latescibacterota bacterium]